MTATATAVRPATERMIWFIGKLSAERGIAFDEAAWTGVPFRAASAEIDRLKAIPRPAARQQGAATPRTPTTEIPAGSYAVPSRTGQNDLDFFRIDKPTEGRWAGFVFVKRIVGGHDPIKVRGAEAASAIAAVEAAGWQEAAAAFGREIGSCSRCPSDLTDVVSRFIGYGSTCRQHVGITVTAETRAAARAWAAERGLTDLLAA
jgi:Family of unknown function (DUF6011)